MPKSQNAVGGILAKVIAEPLLLGRAFLAPSHLSTLAVQRDDMPGTKIETVIAVTRRPGRTPEILEIASGARCVVLVVSRRRTGASFVTAPGLVITLEVFITAVGVGEIADRQNSAWNPVQQLGRCLGAGKVAIHDVAGS